MPKVSIIVPVYKAEKYLKRCVDSLTRQSLKDIEIILVDDGSPDRCGVICDEYAQKDHRIKVVHKENGGLSSARNAGLDAACGEYIGFVDSDDSVMEDMYSKMTQIMEMAHVDFVMSDYNRILSDGTHYLKALQIDGGRYDKEKIRRDIFPSLIMGSNIDYGPLLSVWHCLYRKEFLDRYSLRFDNDVKWSEDNLFSSFAGYYADSFYYLKGQGLYNYYQNPGTITTSYRKGSWNVYLLMNERLHAFFDTVTDYDFTQELKWHLIYYACNATGQTNQLSKTEQRKEINAILHTRNLEQAFQHVDLSGCNVKLKVTLWLMKHHCAGTLAKIINRR